MLLGLVKPSGGRFEILGADTRKPGARARVGFLPEQPYFPQQLTASEAMALYGRLTGLSRAEIAEQTGDLLERVGLEGRQKTILAKFSRGMLQRLGLAQALLGKPEVLVLDEPASGLDPIGQRDVRNLMVSLKQAGATILLSSHQLSEVETISDEVTILESGPRCSSRTHRRPPQRLRPDLAARDRRRRAARRGRRGRVRHGHLRCDDVFSLPDEHVRRWSSTLYDGGWKIVSLQPKRASLEDYFAALLAAGEIDVPKDGSTSKGGGGE